VSYDWWLRRAFRAYRLSSHPTVTPVMKDTAAILAQFSCVTILAASVCSAAAQHHYLHASASLSEVEDTL